MDAAATLGTTFTSPELVLVSHCLKYSCPLLAFVAQPIYGFWLLPLFFLLLFFVSTQLSILLALLKNKAEHALLSLPSHKKWTLTSLPLSSLSLPSTASAFLTCIYETQRLSVYLFFLFFFQLFFSHERNGFLRKGYRMKIIIKCKHR